MIDLTCEDKWDAFLMISKGTSIHVKDQNLIETNALLDFEISW
jgi:hypothetical protein